MENDVRSFLANVQLFKQLSAKNLKRIAGLCKERSYTAGDVIVHQGDEGIGMFIITKGTIKIVKSTDDGQEMEIATHGEGEFFGEFSVIDGATRSANVVAVTDTECLVVPSWDFRALMSAHPTIALEILPVVVKRFRETNAKLLSVTGEA